MILVGLGMWVLALIVFFVGKRQLKKDTINQLRIDATFTQIQKAFPDSHTIWNKCISDLRFYYDALPSSEIKAIYSGVMQPYGWRVRPYKKNVG